MNYDRIILELIDRVSVLEAEVNSLKEQQCKTNANSSVFIEGQKNVSGKDTTKYVMDGKKYSKNRLVLAIVQKYMQIHPHISAAELMAAFDKKLQGSLGVVRTLEDVKSNYLDYETRFFARPDEIIMTRTEPCVVCTQWKITNIGNVIQKAEMYGIEITAVK